MARERTTFEATRVAAIRLYLLASLKRGWKRFRKRLPRCQEKFSEAAVHHSRVESRRLLSTLELTDALFPNKHSGQARKHLKSFLGAFDELRDTQVQLILVGRSGPAPARAARSARRFAQARAARDQTRRRTD